MKARLYAVYKLSLIELGKVQEDDVVSAVFSEGEYLGMVGKADNGELFILGERHEEGHHYRMFPLRDSTHIRLVERVS
jgi:hypothetical protein